MRPSSTAFTIGSHVVDDRFQPSILTTAPNRIVWTLPIPRRSVFRSSVALGSPFGDSPAGAVRFRIGVSDHRIYEGLAEVVLDPHDGRAHDWHDIAVDLSAYAGWKWSLFYRPDRVWWRLVLSVDSLSGRPVRAVWGAPRIETDRDAAQAWMRRLRREQVQLWTSGPTR